MPRHERYLNGPVGWWTYLPWGYVCVMGLRLWLGPHELSGPFDALLFAVFGVVVMVGDDRWGLTTSRHRWVRMIGRLFSVAYGGALLVGSYFILIGQ